MSAQVVVRLAQTSTNQGIKIVSQREKKMEKIYLATYSFGMETNLNMLDKIRTAAEIGYAGVELSGGYEGRSAAEIKAVLDETGIEVDLVPCPT